MPGDDYPIFAEVPETSFLCDGQADGGYYADPEAQCQAFHICANDGQGGRTKFSFLCPNGTLFQQQYFVCDWWFNVDCSLAESFYGLNDQIAAEREAISAAGPAPAGGAQGAGRQASNAGGQRNSAQGGSDSEGASFNAGGGSSGSSRSSSSGGGASASKSGSKTSGGKGGASKGQSAAGGNKRGGSAVAAAASATQNTYASPSSFGGQSANGYGAPAGVFGGDVGFGFGGEAGGSLGGYARSARDLEADQLVHQQEDEDEQQQHHMEDDHAEDLD